MSDRALASILNELDDFREYKLETGGVFLGVIDNDDYYIIDKEEVDIQIKNAQYFYNIVEVYTTQRIKSNS